MSLTVIIRSKIPEVAIVRWFQDPKVSILWASGPVLQMTLNVFRSIGYDTVMLHFREFSNTRISESEAIKPFDAKEGRKLMKGARALEIHEDNDENLIFTPKSIEKYSLVHLKTVSKELELRISANSGEALFWETFDATLQNSEQDGVVL